MKNTIKIFTAIFAMLVALVIVSCYRSTPVVPVADEAMRYKNTSNDHEIIHYSTGGDQITRFAPLDDNERFAFSDVGVWDGQRWQSEMTFYAVRNNVMEDFTILFARRSVTWPDVQFTNDYKRAFFNETRFIGDINTPEVRIDSIYVADGFTGEVRRLLPDMGNNNNWRVSKNGRFISFIRHIFSVPTVIYLFDVENESIVGEFKLIPRIPANRGWNGWSIARFDNIFRIYATVEFGYIAEVVEFNPVTTELRTLWAAVDKDNGNSRLPHAEDSYFMDDVEKQFDNPNVRLQR